MGFPQWANATVATAKEWATSTTEKYKTAVQQAAGVVRPKCKLLSQTDGTVVLPRCKRMARALRATVKGNLRYYVERTFLLIAGSVGLALATYYLWPIMRRVAVVYYATTDVMDFPTNGGRATLTG